MMRSLFQFASFQLMRPGECFALEWSDIDFDRMRVRKSKRVYEGQIDSPKSGAKLIALTRPARDAIVGNSRHSRYVFTTKTGKRMSQGALSRYWDQVRAASGLDHDFYLASKHFGAWFLWTQMGLSEHAIGAQAGWGQDSVKAMLKIYGHSEVGALDEIDAAFKDYGTQGLKLIRGGVTHG
jgi:integrase